MDDLSPTISPEKRREILQGQVTAKMQWGAKLREVREWLAEKHGLTGPDAEQLLEVARNARRSSRQRRALWIFVLTMVLIAVAVKVLMMMWSDSILDLQAKILLIVGASLVCLGLVVRSISELLAGRSKDPEE